MALILDDMVEVCTPPFALNPLANSFLPRKICFNPLAEPFSPKHVSTSESIMEDSEIFTGCSFTSSFLESYQQLIDIELNEQPIDIELGEEPNPLSPKVISTQLNTEVNSVLNQVEPCYIPSENVEFVLDESHLVDLDKTPILVETNTPNISMEITITRNIGEQCFQFTNCLEFGAYYFIYSLSMRIMLAIMIEPVMSKDHVKLPVDLNQEAVVESINLNSVHSIPLPIIPAPQLTEQNDQTDPMGTDHLAMPPDILLQNIRLKNKERIIIGHLNINSIPNKIGLLEDLVHNRVDILLVSETKINGGFPTDQFRIMGFETPFRLDRTVHGGGLLLYIRKDIPAQRKSLIVSGIECITVEVTISKKKWLICGIYNPQKRAYCIVFRCT